MRAICILLLLSAMVLGALSKEAPLRCVTCQTPLGQRFYWFKGAAEEKHAVCEACADLASRCATCRLPVRRDGVELEDGRWLCEADFKSGVFNAQEALRIYEGVRRELEGILAGTGKLPRDNITVALADASQLRKHNQAMPSEHTDQSLVGLTRTKVWGNKQYAHKIYLLSGMSPSRLAAVCAHEYTHTWLHENLPASRQLDRDTIEGFCELVAYKLMAQRGAEGEKKVILANAYTRGQVNAFVQAEESHHFHRIVKWVKTGVDDILPEGNVRGALALRREAEETVIWPPPALMPTAVPEVLTLKGIAGGPGKRFALINDSTLTKNEEARVRVGSTNVTVRCVEIRTRSAVIKVQGSPGVRELFLGRTDEQLNR